MKKISILMGIYNCEATLSEAIESIIAQTYSCWQLIMCDDGSSDRTLEIASSYKRKYPDSIVLIKNKKNLGLNKTLNHCLKYADGDFIARMDADDISLPERFEKEVCYLEEHPNISIVSCPMFYFDENGEWGKGKAIAFPNKMDFVKGAPFCHAPCMVRKEAFRAVGGYSVDMMTMRAEDYDLWFRMYEQGFRGGNLETPLYKMRDDLNAYHRRKFRYCINEAYVRFTGYRRLKLPIWTWGFAIRPIIVGLLPKKIYLMLHHVTKTY